MKNLFVDSKEIGQTRVVVAMSGGVDSSVAAAYLKDLGYEVIGVTLQLYDYGLTVGKKGACCAGQDIYDAKIVAQKLGFPHYVLDYESVFKESVIDDFVDSYVKGETPIPCVRCNQTVKFRDLFKVARDLKADALVTGHYVQKIKGEDGFELHKGIDSSKDQSYFLFATTQEQLDYLFFPLGGLTKDQTRVLAKKYELEVADKPDSQDICFVPNGNYAEVIQKFKPGALDPGEIVDMEGNILGKHDGIINFTIGQRRGIGVATGSPSYVIEIDPITRRVVVGPKLALRVNSFKIKELNWLSKKCDSLEALVKVRNTHRGFAAKIKFEGDEAYIYPKEDPGAITPGQACVIYDDTRLLGGGWITREINKLC